MHARVRTPLVGALVLVAALVMTLRAPSAAADPLNGKIIFSDKRFPTSAKSKKAYFAKLKKQSKASFQEDKQNQSWKIYFAGFAKKPLADLEYTVKIYDVTGKTKSMLVSFEQYSDSAGQKSLLSSFTLERKFVGVNKQLMMVIESQGRTVAVGKFKIVGEAEKYSGKVDFSDEEAAGKGEE